MAERPTPSAESGFDHERRTVSPGQSSLTRQDSEQAYYDAIVSCNATLATTLSLEPLSIATALVAKGIIPENTEAETRNPFYTSLQKASILLAAVRSKVKTSPRSLHEFIKILSQQPWSRDAAEALHASFLSKLNGNLIMSINLCMNRWQVKCIVVEMIIPTVNNN